MDKLDPELRNPFESSRGIKGKKLLTFLEKEKRNIIVCCNNLHSLNVLASSLKKALVKKTPNAVFYGNNELEKFIADSLVDNYGDAFSELVGNEGIQSENHGNVKTILMLKNGEKLGQNEISILQSLAEKAEPEKNKMIIFFNIGISAEKVKQKIDKFGETFFLYDAQDITINEDETDESLSHNRELKKQIDQASDDIPTDDKESVISEQIPKNNPRRIKVIFILLLLVGFLLSLNENVQTKILQIISVGSPGHIFPLLASYDSKQNICLGAQNKRSTIHPNGNKNNKDIYAYR